MSKEYEKFHQNHEDLLAKLLENLNVFAVKFNKGIIPGELEKSDILYLLDMYKEAIDSFGKAEKSYFKRIKSQQSAFDEEKTYHELQSSKECISLLIRLGREKMISTEEEDFKLETGKFLVASGFCDEIVLEQSGHHYYALSEKGEKVVRNKKIVEKIKKDNPMAIIPGRLILDVDKWSDLYARRVECLKKYYAEKKNHKEHIIFTLDEKKEMVFGCELSDSLEVTYYFAGIFDEKKDDHIEQLKRLADSGLIDSIVIVIDSAETAEILEDEGIDSNHTPHISIEQL